MFQTRGTMTASTQRKNNSSNCLLTEKEKEQFKLIANTTPIKNSVSTVIQGQNSLLFLPEAVFQALEIKLPLKILLS